jgi:hypothetical protein
VTYLILLAALRFVGASQSELSAVGAFAAFAIAFWAGAVFPITGSGLGVVDAVLVGALVELSSVSDDVLVAAALLWRVVYSIVTLPPSAASAAPIPTHCGAVRRTPRHRWTPTPNGGVRTARGTPARPQPGASWLACGLDDATL